MIGEDNFFISVLGGRVRGDWAADSRGVRELEEGGELLAARGESTKGRLRTAVKGESAKARLRTGVFAWGVTGDASVPTGSISPLAFI